uniref:Uncharacterized protein n=1 Tax=Chionoecetes opilio bacilliform virus TaxID=1825681 RepID=A0A1Q3DKW1_9VIRU|nr:hypothetical protein SCV_063 [Chionoecetes opilio bacilliform virus]
MPEIGLCADSTWCNGMSSVRDRRESISIKDTDWIEKYNMFSYDYGMKNAPQVLEHNNTITLTRKKNAQDAMEFAFYVDNSDKEYVLMCIYSVSEKRVIFDRYAVAASEFRELKRRKENDVSFLLTKNKSEDTYTDEKTLEGNFDVVKKDGEFAAFIIMVTKMLPPVTPRSLRAQTDSCGKGQHQGSKGKGHHVNLHQGSKTNTSFKSIELEYKDAAIYFYNVILLLTEEGDDELEDITNAQVRYDKLQNHPEFYVK